MAVHLRMETAVTMRPPSGGLLHKPEGGFLAGSSALSYSRCTLKIRNQNFKRWTLQNRCSTVPAHASLVLKLVRNHTNIYFNATTTTPHLDMP